MARPNLPNEPRDDSQKGTAKGKVVDFRVRQQDRERELEQRILEKLRRARLSVEDLKEG